MILDFSAPYVLEDESVRMEPLEGKHAQLLESVAQEKGIWTYFLGRSNGWGDFQKYVDDAVEHRIMQKEYPFAVYDKNKRQYAGSTRFFDYSRELGNIRLGYTWYGKDFRGTGVNKHCKYLLFAFALEKLGMERVGLGAHSENKVSIAAMKSVGCVHEGTLRNLFPSINGNGRADGMLFSMTKTDWRNAGKNQLKKKL